MAAAGSVTGESNRIRIDYTGVGVNTLLRSFVDDVNFADIIHSFSIADDLPAGSVYDTSCVQRWTYYYWIGTLGDPISIGSARMMQHKVFGKKGSKKQYTQQRTVECPLCGFEYKKSKLKRGYVKTHVTGENYLPNAAAPENWTHTVGPTRFDANSYFQLHDIEQTLVFPQFEKDFGYYYPGVPYLTLSDVITIGSPSAGGTGYAIFYVYFSQINTASFRVMQPSAVATVATDTYQIGWHKIISPSFKWDTTSMDLWISLGLTATPSCAFGGMQLVINNPELSTLPDRLTGIGEYTTGGMMDLCPDCHSGLRRRVPWE